MIYNDMTYRKNKYMLINIAADFINCAVKNTFLWIFIRRLFLRYLNQW